MSIGKIIIFILFLAFGFSIVPLMIKLFIYLQGVIGNSELWLVKMLNDNYWTAVGIVWGIFILGFLIALPAMMKDGFFDEFKK
jgi:hypothetical protein